MGQYINKMNRMVLGCGESREGTKQGWYESQELGSEDMFRKGGHGRSEWYLSFLPPR